MKKFIGLALTCTIFSYFLFLSFDNVKDAKATTSTLLLYSEKNKLELINNKVIKEENNVNINLSIPYIEGLNDLDFQYKLNKEIETYILGIKKDVENTFEKDSRYAKEKGFQLPIYEVKSNYIITYKDENIVSFIINIYKFTGGTYGVTDKRSYTLDLKNERILELQDLFKEDEDFQTVINNKISEDIAKNKNLYFSKNLYKINYDQQFYIDNNDIVVYFPMNEISPYVFGIPEFKIPFTNFYSGLNIHSIEKHSIPQITTIENFEYNKYINIKVKKPMIVSEDNKVNNKINNYINKNIENFVTSLEKEAKNIEGNLKKKNEVFIPYSVNINYSILKNNKSTIVVGLVKTHYDGNNFKTMDSIITIDLRTGQINEK